MPYEIQKRPTRLNGTEGWRVVWNDYAADGSRKQRLVNRAEWPTIGFSPTMTKDEARSWAKSVNESDKNRKTEARRNKVQERIKAEAKSADIYLPEELVKVFELEVLERRFRKKLNSPWNAAKKLVAEIKMEPSTWCRMPEPLYNYFAEKTVSYSYSEKMLRTLNLWGEFLFYKTGKSYLPIKAPTGSYRQRIVDSYLDSSKTSKESEPITPDDLSRAKQLLAPASYNYLAITVWFGLRPHEVDNLTNGPSAWFLSEEEGYQVFNCYQPKLVGVPRNKRWKKIPVLFDEQRRVIDLIKSGDFKRPLPKTLRKHLNKNANNYGGRKGFEHLMRTRGRTFVEAQAWLGHASIERTWRDYRNKNVLFLEKP